MIRILNGLIIALLVLGSLAFGQKTWTAGTSGNWSTGANWSGGTVPTSADSVVLSGLVGSTVITIDANGTCGALNMGAAASGVGTLLQFPASGAITLTVTVSGGKTGSVLISGGSGSGVNNTRPKLTANGNASATLAVEGNITTTVSNTAANNNTGLNMNEGSVLLAGTTPALVLSGAGFRLGALQIGDGTNAKSVTIASSTSSATITLAVSAITVKTNGTVLLGQTSEQNLFQIGNLASGIVFLTGGVTVETGGTLAVQAATGATNHNLVIQGGGITNNGTMTLIATNRNLNIGFAGNSSNTISGSGVLTVPGLGVSAGSTVTLASNINVASGGMLGASGTLDCATKQVGGAGALGIGGASAVTTGTTVAFGYSITGVGSMTGIVPGMAVTGTGINAGTFVVAISGTTVFMSASATAANAGLTFSGTGTLVSASATGINGSVTLSGGTTLTNGSFKFNGSSAQVTGSALPAVVTDLYIQNASGVTMSQPVTVNGVLTLAAGNLDNSVNQVTLGPSGSMVNTGGSISQNPLPVELSSFSAIVHEGKVELAWTTKTEISNYGFDVERSATSKENWAKVAFVAGNGTSNVAHNYSFAENVSIGRYSYRLKQIDRDGKFQYSPTVEASVGLTPNTMILGQNYPNPFNPETKIEFAVPATGFTTLKVYNMLGAEVSTLVNGTVEAGVLNQVSFKGANFPSGMYFYTLRSGNFIDTKKMLMIK